MSPELDEFLDLDVIDCHVHTWMLRNSLSQETLHGQGEALAEIIAEGGLKGMYVFDSLTHAPLFIKAANPGPFYAGGYAPWTGRTHQLQARANTR